MFIGPLLKHHGLFECMLQVDQVTKELRTNNLKLKGLLHKVRLLDGMLLL